MSGKVLDTTSVRERLRRRHDDREWCYFEEVTLSGRRIDAVAFNRWQSRGYAVHAFEIKTSRSDWLRELKDGSKAEAIFAEADFMWLAVGDKSIVRDGELPRDWGLIVPSGRGMRVAVQATETTVAHVLGRELFMRLLQVQYDGIEQRIANACTAARREGYDDGKAAAEAPSYDDERMRTWYEACRAAGVSTYVDERTAKPLQAFAAWQKAMQDNDWNFGGLTRQINRAHEAAQDRVQRCEAALEALAATNKPDNPGVKAVGS